MNIKQYKKFKFQYNDYSLLNIKSEYPISYIAIFFYDAFRHIYKSGTIKFINKLKNYEESGINSEMIELNLEKQNNLAYISEPYDNSTKKITPEINDLIEKQSTIELCHKNFIGYTILTQNNLFYLFIKWKEIIDNKDPFFLLYLDDNDWYDVEPFDTQEAMEQFIVDHTKIDDDNLITNV